MKRLKECRDRAASLLPWSGGKKLISVWELMNAFSGQALFSCAKIIGGASGTLDGANLVYEMLRKQGDIPANSRDLTISPPWRDTLLEYQELLAREICKDFDLPASVAMCEEIISDLKSEEPPKFTDIQSKFSELAGRIEAELKAHLFLYINREYAKFCNEPLSGWENVIGAFPKATYDVEEASKCVAFRRNTAAVFHLMRVTGAGVTALGKSLNEPTLDASHNLTWDNILTRCVKELSEKFSGKSPEWQTDKEFYAAATANLLAVKEAWRNPNAHEVGQKYTDEEALDIYNAVRTFMRQLSKKLKEQQ